MFNRLNQLFEWRKLNEPIFKYELYYGEAVAEKLFDQGLCLPSGSNLIEKDFERIFKVLDTFFLTVTQ
jgi:dTDP-4-amino-4,6-dideoxygalactose transaminase